MVLYLKNKTPGMNDVLLLLENQTKRKKTANDKLLLKIIQRLKWLSSGTPLELQLNNYDK